MRASTGERFEYRWVFSLFNLGQAFGVSYERRNPWLDVMPRRST
jgi:hypothetical protein